MTEIIPYSEWGRAGQGGATIGPVSEVIIHHWWRPHIPDASRDREADALRGVEQFHMSKGWGGGTGYQFHAFRSGRVWEGRGWRRSGAHTVGRNGSSVAVALPINGDQYEPTDGQTDAVRTIIREGLAGGHIRPGYRVTGHRHYSSKSCPGRLVSGAWLAGLEGLDADADRVSPPEEDEMLVKFEDDGKIMVLYTGSGRVVHLSPSAYDAVNKLAEKLPDQVASVGKIDGLTQAGAE